MKTLKSFTIFTLAVFFLIALSGLTLAQDALSISDIDAPSNVDEDKGSFAVLFNLTFTGETENITVDFNDSEVDFGSISIPRVVIEENSSDIIAGVVSFSEGHGGETLTGTINASSLDGNHSVEEDFSVSINDVSEPDESEPFEIQECSETGNLGNNLRTDIDDIRVKDGFGDYDDYWYPLDNIEMDVEVRNRGDRDIDDIEIHWGLYDEDDESWIIDDRESDFDLYDGEDRTETINFKLDDVRDFRDTDRVKLYVWAVGEDEEFDFNETCQSISEEIDIINDDDFVILDDIRLSQENIDCGDNIELTADVWNMKDRRQRDVKVRLSIEELDIYEEVELGEIRDHDYRELREDFEIPEDAEEGDYHITLEIYDRDGDLYETDDRETGSTFYPSFEIIGGCQEEDENESLENIVISANLASGGTAGEELVINSNIINTGDTEKTLSISAEEYNSWAELASIDPEEVSVSEGDSTESNFNFDISEDASGEKTFNIVVVDENGNSYSQPVQVSIKEAEKSFFDNIELNQNTIIIVLATLIAVVIILIIIVLIMKIVNK